MRTKRSIFLLLFIMLLIVIYSLPNKISANNTEMEATVFSTDSDEILLYEDLVEKTVINIIPINETVTYLGIKEKDYSYIRYEYVNEKEEIVAEEGYVESIYLKFNNNEESLKELEVSSEENFSELLSKEDNSTNITTDENNKEIDNQQNAFSDNVNLKTKEKAMKVQESTKARNKLLTTFSTTTEIRGVAAKDITNIRTSPSTEVKVLTKVDRGTVLKLKQYNQYWYEVTINGKKGYIHKNHFEAVTNNQQKIRGVTKKSPTNVREQASTKSKRIHSFPVGSVIEYYTFSKHWYEVKLNGNRLGYIHKKHVENAKSNPKTYLGITMKSPTNVRAIASTKSEVITTIPVRSIIEYNEFTTHWNEVTVNVNGKRMKGYIHVKHLQNANGVTLRGVASKNKTYIRTSPSTKSTPLTIVDRGTVLQYQVHNLHWYKVTVNVNGKMQTGYVHKKHTENAVMNQKTIRGVALKSPTNVRTYASTKASRLTTFKIGTIFNYRTFSKHWYEISYGDRLGYIHKKHVANATSNPIKSRGVALKNKTYIRSIPSTKSVAVTTVPKGTLLNYKTFNKNWYEVQVNQGGKTVTGFIHRKHLGQPKVIVIDAGHGGHDPGAMGNNLREKDINIDIAKRVQKLLSDAGYKVIMTRSSDEYMALHERSSLANKSNADLFVSIHTNAGGGQGIETWWYSNGPESQKSKVLAEQIQNEVIKQTNARNRGVQDGNLHVNRETKMPSALIEVGFIDNKNDAEKLKSTNYRSQVARGIANGIKKFLNLYN